MDIPELLEMANDNDESMTVETPVAESTGLPHARAKTLARHLPVVAAAPDLVPARMINEVLYCERLLALEWGQGEFADNYFTVDGRSVHKRADLPNAPLQHGESGSADSADSVEDSYVRPGRDRDDLPYQARAVWLSSERLGITARIDIVDVDGGAVIPVEYKRGKKPKLPEGAYVPERAQLCAHVLLLREHGFRCEEAHIYFAADHQRVPIAITDELIQTTLDAVHRAREVAGSSKLPLPLDDSPKCRGCSLVGICLPDETALLALDAKESNDFGSPATSASEEVETFPEVLELRRLHPARDDKLPLYVQDQGGRVGVSGDVLKVTCRNGEVEEARISNTSQVCVFGNVQVSTQALRKLMDRGIPVAYFTYGGWLVGRAVGHDTKNVDLRLSQYDRAMDPAFCKAFPFGAACADEDTGTQTYDAFGRTVATRDLDDTITLLSVYHALETDMWDAADIYESAHEDTPATERKDGHGRTSSMSERFGTSERVTTSRYLPTGEPQVITRTLAGTSEKVVRWMRYDSLGRMTLNVEPNTSENFDDDETTDPDEIKAWRYAYNDVGDLVGTSDSRGCGVNFAYDGAGRLLYEDYSPCLDSHAAYSAPADTTDPTATTGVEVLYYYDVAPPTGHFPSGMTPTSFLTGRLVAVYDRASLTVSNYDALGRVFETAVRVAKAGAPDTALDDRYAARWYQRDFVFDSSDREVASTTGSTVSDLQGTTESVTGSTSAVRTHYTARGTVGQVDGSYGTLVDSVARDPDGMVRQIVYGDVTATTSSFGYDQRRRLDTITTDRDPNPDWTAAPPPSGYLPAPSYNGSTQQDTYQSLLQDEALLLDAVGNPIAIYDNRDPDYWPASADPVHREFTYDNLYRLTSVEYTYTGDDDWVAPFDAENQNNMDPRRAKPSPHTDFDERIHEQTFTYDWMGNTASSSDDAHGFFDRSLGDITNDTANDKPYQLNAADNKGGSPADRDGELEAAYDATGNLVRLQVERDQDFCLPAGPCSAVFAYEWDEVGRLVRASRWDVATLPDMTDPLPSEGDADAILAYAYDAGDQRVIKSALDPTDPLDPELAIHSLYVFETLELRRAAFTSGEYVLDEWTEVPYLFAHGVRLARVVYEDTDVPTLDGAQMHVFFELGDHLGSTSVVLDSATGELVERSTMQAYGAAESDYRPDRWETFREDYRFTGKEEDVQVGLTYFGKRFLSPYLNRWVSADPLAVHMPGEADLNVYAYAKGRALQAIDPVGLDTVAPLLKALERMDTHFEQRGDYLALKTVRATNDRATKLEHGALAPTAIVLHFTAMKKANDTMRDWKNGGNKYGTQFLVGEDGTIHQTASLNQTTWHVSGKAGERRSKCAAEGSCTKNGQPVDRSPSAAEQHDDYPNRFPFNEEAIGIEISLTHDGKGWRNLSSEQVKSVQLLVGALKDAYFLKNVDVYAHVDIQRKAGGEGIVPGVTDDKVRPKMLERGAPSVDPPPQPANTGAVENGGVTWRF